ncbi:hypothetical protein DXU93_11675 [Brumimicrobium aurantiacum]|uniref:ATPase BadF/BadG/BcrA/BcrD type domain-containing protein n=2 Tax=Brumimicrobium aurantiacum TaxID=1737063 RepID=A0A3E1EW47_9FLAO|nr:hypothetical protein DXU93_11675 [Brumimicrobium aurantiacum]
MIVIESGGTKSTWVFNLPNDLRGKDSFRTIGLHPQELNSTKAETIKALVQEHQLQNQEVHFFGAGCESEEAKVKIKKFLEAFGLDVQQVQTDLHAACVAHLGQKRGMVGIIGTGAVAALFNGEKVIQQSSGLGYMLGDEGSGFDIGKRLIVQHLNHQLPSEITKEIDTYFEYRSIVHRVQESDGRMKIAGLTKIVRKYSDDPVIFKILKEAFSDFCKTALLPIQENHPIHFIGSVAYYFQEELKSTLSSMGYEMGGVEKEAVEGVFEFLNKR